MRKTGRHRLVRPGEESAGPAEDTIEARLLGRPATMGRRDVSRGAQVSPLSARKFWHALGFPIVEDEDAAFTEADLVALKAVARLVREEQFDEQTALAMTRAFARTTDRLAVWQTQPWPRRSPRLSSRPPSTRPTGAPCPTSTRPAPPPTSWPSSPTTSSRCSSTPGAAT